MRKFAVWACLAVAVFFAACSKDKETGKLGFDAPAVFLQAGQTASIGFSAAHVSSFTVTSQPAGWPEPVVDAAARTVTITAPEQFDDEVVRTGSLVLTGSGGGTASATLFVAVVEDCDMSAHSANSYLLSRSETHYLFDARSKGDGSALATASVGIIWQSRADLIRYLTLLEDGRASFYVGSDDDGEHIEEGNALVGGYDGSGKLIWSWHLWAADFDPEADAVEFNGYTVMNRNLGALAAANSTTEEILDSYGLFYQWGRKEPFIGPAAYNAANGSSATMYDGSSTRVYLKDEASDAEVGTVEYAVQHPLVFIRGVADSGYDWMWSPRSEALWADVKTVYDPCPYGWRVAPAAAFDGLNFGSESADWPNTRYGAILEKSGVSALFLGAGRRDYNSGKFQNFYFSDQAPRSTRAAEGEGQPWVGLYWTTGMQPADRVSSALYFYYGGTEVEPAHGLRRANGLPVRCVKE